MNALRLGRLVRAVRHRRGLRQVDVAARAGVSQSVVSRLERGDVATLSLAQIEAICAVLEIRVELVGRWRGGDADRLLNAGHAALHDSIAKWFASRWTEWVLAPEVSFAIYGERGVIDILAWHAPTRTLLVIELKTELVDLNELVGTADRKRRLAIRVARERGWDATHVGLWVVVASTRTNRRHLATHHAFLRNALPDGGQAVRRWLGGPKDRLAAVSLETFASRVPRTPKRVRATGR